MSQRKKAIVSGGKSPSTELMKISTKRAFLTGGAVQDFSTNVENIREISRKLNYDICNGEPSIRRNLFNYSENFTQSVWLKVNSTITSGAETAPDGLMSGSILQQNGTAVSFSRRLSTNVVLNGPYTLSVYAKKKDFDGIIVGLFSGFSAAFNLVSGTIISTTVGSTSTIEDAGNGWWRCSVSGIASGVTRTDIVLSDASGNFVFNDTNTFGNYIWGAQLETGLTPTKYQYTNGSYFDFMSPASFIYVPSICGESRVYGEQHNPRNLTNFSDEFENSFWVKANSTIVPNSTAIFAPNGSLTADKFNETAVNNQHRLESSASQTRAVGDVTTYSIYAKAAERSNIAISIDEAGISFPIGTMDLTGGTISALQTFNPTINYVGDGWYRGSITVTTVNPGATKYRLLITLPDGSLSYTGVTNTGVYIWGAQIENGPYLTPYQKISNAGDGILDLQFTRATSATRTNKQGIVFNSSYNLFTQSEVFDNAAWAKTNMTVTANQTLSPTNVLSADKIVSSNGFGGVLNFSFTINSGQTYTLSVYAKKEGFNFVALSLSSAFFPTSNRIAIFDLDNGIVGSASQANTNATIVDVGDGWFRCSITLTAIVTGTGVVVAIGDRPSNNLASVGDGVNGVYVWGAQFTRGVEYIDAPYQRSTTRLNVPRLDYSRLITEASFLLEPARTNLLLQSETFINASWTKLNCTTTASGAIAPNGLLIATRVTDSTSNTGKNVRQLLSGQPAIQTYSGSIYVKQGGITTCSLGLSDNVANASYIHFDLTNGNVINTITTGTGFTNFNYSTTLLPNGYVYAKINGTKISSSTNILFDIPLKDGIYSGTGTDSIYLWGAQLEVGNNSTTYIPTTTAAVARNAETSFTDLFNNARLDQNNFTLFVEGYLYDNVPTNLMVALSNTNSTGSRGTDIGFFDGIRATYANGGVVTSDSSNLPINSTFKFIITRNGTSVRFYRNGSQIWTNQSVPVSNYRYLVMNNGGSTYSIDKVLLFKRTFTDAECILLTT